MEWLTEQLRGADAARNSKTSPWITHYETSIDDCVLKTAHSRNASSVSTTLPFRRNQMCQTQRARLRVLLATRGPCFEMNGSMPDHRMLGLQACVSSEMVQ